jgi:uncharacterized membrane protein YphA (DoxX/SURF4 family)
MNKNQTTEGVSRAYTLLRLTYGIIPIAAGADKFLNILTDWSSYAPEGVVSMLGISAGAFMAVIGIIEILAGAFLLINTKLGAYVVSAWLVLIALSLIFTASHYDVAVRDIVMAVGAFALAQLAVKKKQVPVLV